MGNTSFRIALDAKSARSMDANGFMHVKRSHITKAAVNPYYGREIPGGIEHGLDAEKIYYGLRDPEELEKSVPTWAGLPLHIEHHIDSATDPQKLTRVGTTGTEIRWSAPYLDAPLTVWDQQAIDGINDGSFRELSCAYDPIFKPGIYQGKPYDFVMSNIRGNHVALVEEGRAGPDVLVADAKPAGMAEQEQNMEHDAATEQKEVDLAQAIIDLHKVDPLTGKVIDVAEDDGQLAELRLLIDKIKAKTPPEDFERLISLLGTIAQTVRVADKPKEGEVMADQKKACDETPEESKAFGEGVEYGEELIRDPEERAKLDREHESEGMKDAEDEELEEAESEEISEDEEADEVAVAIMESVKKLTPEQKAKLKETLEEAIKAKPAADEDKVEEKEEVVAAVDRALAKKVQSIAAKAAAHMMQAHSDVKAALRKVRPLVGEMDPMAFDSASSVYKSALEQLGVPCKGYGRAEYKAVVEGILAERTRNDEAIAFAVDSKPAPKDGPFRFLKNIRVSR